MDHSPLARSWPILLALVALLAEPLFGSTPFAAAQSASPVSAADAVRSNLFDAQEILLSGQGGAAANVTAARTAADPLFAAFPADGTASGQLSAGFAEAAEAVQHADAPGPAYARAQIWTGILAGAYERTVGAIEAGDAAAARSWFLVREFRLSTKFDRPGA
jgi:hypothetical protein